MRALAKADLSSITIHPRAEQESRAPAPMPSDNASDLNENNNNYQCPIIDYHAIRQWTQRVEPFRASLPPSADNYYFSSTMIPIQQLASGARSWAPVWQTSPEEDLRESASLMEITHWPGIDDPTSPSCPPAPLLPTVPLPPVNEGIEEEVSTTPNRPDLSIQSGPISRSPITTSDHRRRGSAHHRRVAVQPPTDIPANTGRPEETAGQQLFIANELGFQESIRPVVEPVLSDMPAYDGHCWGARDESKSVLRQFSVHFPQSTKSATIPPLQKMRLVWPFGGTLVITPTIGNQFVSVVDVQRTVIARMRAGHPYVRDECFRLTERTMARARDGMTMSVEVWVWMGLTRVMGETNLWEIHL